MNDNTKTKIIENAIKLFNEHGYENVSMRNIAESLNISPGNLTYHFNKKTDILYEIIQEMMIEHEKKNYTPELTLSEFHNILSLVSEHQRKYRFYFRNIIELQNKYPRIAKMQADYKEEFLTLINGILQHFVRNGWMQKECLENMYSNLSLAILSITTFWTQFHMDLEMNSVVWSILYPNLTKKGIIEYQNLFRE